jgi:holin-like protein
MAMLILNSPRTVLIRDAAMLAGQIALLWLVNWLAHRVVEALHIPLPGNVAAVLLMFLLLQMRLVPLTIVERSSTLLLRHLALFFTPIAVGLMTFATLSISSGLSIVATLLVSAAIGFTVTGCLCQSFARRLDRASTSVALPSHEHHLDHS